VSASPRAIQKTHAPAPGLVGFTLCGRRIAGSMELDALRPTAECCARIVARGLQSREELRRASREAYALVLARHASQESTELTRYALDAAARGC